jgi:hypothetical protein
VWDCAFAPDEGGELAANVVATCGGNVVCLIDVELGKVRGFSALFFAAF